MAIAHRADTRQPAASTDNIIIRQQPFKKMMQTMDPREASFLASQAERLTKNKKQQTKDNENSTTSNHSGDDGAPESELVNDANDNDNAAIDIGVKEKSHRFWKSFRSLCSGFQSKIDSLLLLSPSPSTAALGNAVDTVKATAKSSKISNNENAKAYYATAARRNEGRIKLDSVLQNVRSLQRHVLSSSSSVTSTAANNVSNDDELLQSILKNPMPDITQTDTRLLSQEIDCILKRIDIAREVICPKEKFVFKRYRQAMEDRESSASTLSESNEIERERDHARVEKEEVETKNQQEKNLRSKYGGVLENMSDCTVEITSVGTILINETTDDQLYYYSKPRPVIHASHPSSPANNEIQQQQQSITIQESSSYLLQNLQNVTVLVHGSRPSLHLQHIQNCRIYVSEPTLGPVHVTNCRSSEIRCRCYQLRLHDSKDVKFSVWVRSGPIIEDCNGMVFDGNYYSDEVVKNRGCNGNDGVDGSLATDGVIGRNMFWDVKDFNWLRALRKSPNFVVITKKTSDVGNDEKPRREETFTKSYDDVAPKDDKSTTVPEEEDSEDEL